MAGKGGTAVLLAIAIGVSLALVDQSTTSSSSSSSSTSSSASSTASATASSTVSTSASATEATNRPSSVGTTTATSNSTVVVTSDNGTERTRLSTCPGQVVGQATQNDLTLSVYYDAQARGMNCASAGHQGAVTAPGFLRVEIRVDGYTGTDWPRYDSKDGAPGVAEVAGAYLIATDGRCVSATATFFPAGAGGPSSSVSLPKVGCG